ncbi:MAG: CheR family methyltransferase [Polyangiaceae bacterium]
MTGSYVDLDRFRSFIEGRFGLCLSEHPDHLTKVVRDRMAATGSRDFAAYDALLTTSAESSKELRAVVEVLTVGETYFFRNGDHFRALVEHAVPGRLREAGGRRPLSVLSAGCASGEEPYTIAILMREHFPELGPSDVTITGVDLNPAAIAKARRARYSPWSLRETTQAVQSRYFRPEGSEAGLAEEIRGMVEFEERNLFDVDLRFWASKAFDIVFCRNVIIYFSQEKLGEAIARLSHVLSPGGYLFLGHSESLRGMTDDFDLLNTNSTFYYQRRDPSAPRAETSTSSWTSSIDRASWRVRQLTSRPAPPLTSTPDAAPPAGLAVPPSLLPDPPPSLTATLDLATELYQQERFAEALDRLDAVPPGLRDDVTIQLLRAAVLTNQGELKAAEAVCRRVLAVDDRNAGAHYLTALLRDREGDREAAVRHDEMAAYLDATFAMPRLHLGMLARQGGDLPSARRELSRALLLLGREDASRVLLFGGGFGRDALVGLCKAELRAAGGKS